MRRERIYRRRRLGVGLIAACSVALIVYSCGGGGDPTTEVAVDGESTVRDGDSADRLQSDGPAGPPAPAPPPTQIDGAVCPPAPATVRAKLAYLTVPALPPRRLAEAEAVLTTADRPSTIFVKGDLDATTGARVVELRTRTGTTFTIDDEGGTVQGIKPAVGPMPSAARQAELGPEGIRALLVDRGRALRSLGITWNFAPVVDLRAAGSESVIGSRSYGADPASVTAAAGAAADGLRDAGVVPTIKHFPGHGRGEGDSHEVPVRTPPLAELRAADLAPYRDLLARPGPWAVMVGHLDVPGLTEPGLPTSLSPATYRLLREDVGFEGLVITDSLGMGAVVSRFPVGEASATALAAGADVTLLPDLSYFAEALDAGEARVASGELTEDRLDRSVERLRRLQRCAA